MIMYTKEQAKEEIRLLVEKYQRIKDSGRINEFNEERTKKEFIEPLFEVLGWDVRNKYSDDEVIVEEKISKGRVDYSFRINGIPKFFLEAKSLKEDLSNIKFIEQAINYSWHKSCTWAILTDFEELKVFNAEWKTLNFLQNQFLSFSYNTYLEKFEKLWWLSRESFEKGILDKEAEELGKKTKKIPVDKQLLQDLIKFRDLLTKNILKNNSSKNLNPEDLDESIQRIIDRLIFIRVCEDKQLEQPILQPLIREQQNKKTYKKLNEAFRKFDDKYNSKLFSLHLCEELVIDDEILEQIIKGLFKTQNNLINYDFSAIEADFLGNIYEQYLGHILKKSGKKTKLAENHLHRKEQGIYYTPTYIVDYIVKNTLSDLFKDKSLDEILNKKILDPTCGSGSFLIRAFLELCKIVEERLKKGERSKEVISFKDYNERLNLSQKIYILLNCIFGVDLDEKAVEIAQLNLLLKLLEGETRNTLFNVREMKKLLPVLNNIKCGNSLIDELIVAGNKAFKWEEEFKEIIKEGGFDVIIGNPPYIRTQLLNDSNKSFFEKKYISAKKQYDIYILFIEKAINLLKEGGLLGFIVPNKFLVSDYGFELRKIILNKTNIIQIINVSNLDVFKGVGTYPIIIILRKEKPNQKNKIIVIDKVSSPDYLINNNFDLILQERFVNNDKNLFVISSIGKSDELIKKIMKESVNLGEIAEVLRGVIPEHQKDYVLSSEEYNKLSKSDKENCKKALRARDIDNYNHIWKGEYFFYHKKININRSKSFKDDKIIMPRTVLSLEASYDKEGYTLIDRLYYIKTKSKNFDNKYLLALLNSKLINFYYRMTFGATHLQGGYLDLKGIDLEKIPIKIIENKKQNQVIELVDKIISLNKRLNEIGGKKTDERAKIEKEIQKIDDEIDEFIYKIYGITEEEQKIIEDSFK